MVRKRMYRYDINGVEKRRYGESTYVMKMCWCGRGYMVILCDFHDEGSRKKLSKDIRNKQNK